LAEEGRLLVAGDTANGDATFGVAVDLGRRI
jgi:hypothetical protein